MGQFLLTVLRLFCLGFLALLPNTKIEARWLRTVMRYEVSPKDFCAPFLQKRDGSVTVAKERMCK